MKEKLENILSRPEVLAGSVINVDAKVVKFKKSSFSPAVVFKDDHHTKDETFSRASCEKYVSGKGVDFASKDIICGTNFGLMLQSNFLAFSFC